MADLVKPTVEDSKNNCITEKEVRRKAYSQTAKAKKGMERNPVGEPSGNMAMKKTAILQWELKKVETDFPKETCEKVK